ncbi:MAG TPA: hypothetical protein VLD62_06590 [Acidimicrobiia bacterium]|nr:hypothetical protein [Acidimicrobiia bacterium]
MRIRFLALVAALALVAVACGTESTSDAAGAPTVTDAPTETLPPNPAAGACLAGAPDCQDIPGAGLDEPPILEDEPDLSVDPSEGVSGFVVGGGLTVAEALTTDATGVLAVKGFVVADGDGIRLCELLAESMPPQCGGASIEMANLDAIDPDELKTDQGVTWSDFTVTVLGEIVDGVLTPTPFSA